MTGYTYIPVIVIVFLQVLLGLKCPVAWAETLASSGVAMPLQIQIHSHKSSTPSCLLTLPDQSNIASYALAIGTSYIAKVYKFCKLCKIPNWMTFINGENLVYASHFYAYSYTKIM